MWDTAMVLPGLNRGFDTVEKCNLTVYITEDSGLKIKDG